MSTERITVDGESHVIETRQVNLIVNTSPSEVRYERREVFDPEASLARYRALTEIDPLVASLWRIVICDFAGEVTKESIDQCQTPYQQVIGLIMLTVEAIVAKTRFVWRRPESGLHPRHQVGLADLMLLFSDRERLIEFVASSQHGGQK